MSWPDAGLALFHCLRNTLSVLLRSSATELINSESITAEDNTATSPGEVWSNLLPI